MIFFNLTSKKFLLIIIPVGLIAMFLVIPTLLQKIEMLDGKNTELSNVHAILFETPAWQRPGELILRKERAESESLLLKHSKSETLYRYDPTTQKLSQISSDLWHNARGSIEKCDLQVAPAPWAWKLRIDKSDKLRFEDREIPTAGNIALVFNVAPSGKSVAVLSAEGPKSSSVQPFLGEGGASGQHYHQVLSLPDLASTEKPILVPLSSKDVGITMCWTPGERYVVYADILFYYLSFAPNNMLGR